MRFRQVWPSLKTSTNDIVTLKANEASQQLFDKREELVALFVHHLTEKHPRDDYRELLELSVIILGGMPPRGIHLIRPGALHRARWMAKIIYTLKIWLLKDQFKLTAREKSGLQRFINFVLLSYITMWFCASQATKAPANDLRFFQSLSAYSTIDKPLSEAVTSVFSRHLWYLSEHLVALALFDPETPSDILEEMVAVMISTEDQEEQGELSKKAKITVSSAAEKRLVDFVSSQSAVLLDRLGCGRGFLRVPPSDWHTNSAFLLGRRRAKALSVTNDRAERALALLQNYNLNLTKNESQQQFLLQLIEMHRKEHPMKN